MSPKRLLRGKWWGAHIVAVLPAYLAIAVTFLLLLGVYNRTTQNRQRDVAICHAVQRFEAKVQRFLMQPSFELPREQIKFFAPETCKRILTKPD